MQNKPKPLRRLAVNVNGLRKTILYVAWISGTSELAIKLIETIQNNRIETI